MEISWRKLFPTLGGVTPKATASVAPTSANVPRVPRSTPARTLGPPLLTMRSQQQMGLMIWWKPFNRSDLQRVEELIAAGKLRPVIDRRYPLSEIVDALKWVNDGHAQGKVVITF